MRFLSIDNKGSNHSAERVKSVILVLSAAQKTPKRSSGSFSQRRKYQNGRRERSCSAGIIKTVVGELLAAQKTPKRSSGTFLQRRNHKNGRRGRSCSVENIPKDIFSKVGT
jgi:hypothetical protein